MVAMVAGFFSKGAAKRVYKRVYNDEIKKYVPKRNV